MEDEGLDPIDEENIFPLTDEFGNTQNFEFLDLIEYDSEQYVVLLPVEEEEQDKENFDDSVVVILKLDDSDTEDEEVYSSVDDPEVIQAVFEIFKEKFKDEFTFMDDEESLDNVNLTNPETFADIPDDDENI